MKREHEAPDLDAREADRLARAYLLHARAPGKPAVARMVLEHGATRAAQMVSARWGEWWVSAAREITELTSRLRLVVPGDEEWPTALTDPAAPLGLWVSGEGQLDQLTARVIVITGGREATPRGTHTAEKMGAELSRAGWTVATAGRFGVDGAALRGAERAKTPALVLPLGALVEPHPLGHRNLFGRLHHRSLLVSEHGVRRPTDHADSRRQGRLLATLCSAVVVLEPPGSGLAGSCIHFAAKAGRPVLAVPGPVDSPAYRYAHRLIRTGRARLVASASDVLADIT